jgi:hypothetical protein
VGGGGIRGEQDLVGVRHLFFFGFNQSFWEHCFKVPFFPRFSGHPYVKCKKTKKILSAFIWEYIIL